MTKPLLLSFICLVTFQVLALPDYDPFADATAGLGTAYTTGASLIGQVNAAG